MSKIFPIVNLRDDRDYNIATFMPAFKSSDHICAIFMNKLQNITVRKLPSCHLDWDSATNSPNDDIQKLK
jgi:hypothetical protein